MPGMLSTIEILHPFEARFRVFRNLVGLMSAMDKQFVCHHFLDSIIISDELPNLPSVACELSGLVSSWKDLERGHAPGIENSSGV
jgi:hypothetical protein